MTDPSKEALGIINDAVHDGILWSLREGKYKQAEHAIAIDALREKDGAAYRAMIEDDAALLKAEREKSARLIKSALSGDDDLWKEFVDTENVHVECASLQNNLKDEREKSSRLVEALEKIIKQGDEGFAGLIAYRVIATDALEAANRENAAQDGALKEKIERREAALRLIADECDNDCFVECPTLEGAKNKAEWCPSCYAKEALADAEEGERGIGC